MRTSQTPPATPLFSTRDAADYLRFKSTSGIRTAVMRGELVPCGAGPKACHMFTVAELDRFVAARGERYAERLARDRPAITHESCPPERVHVAMTEGSRR